MAVRVEQHLFAALGALRYEPTPKRVRALVGEHAAVDSTRALLLWEPRRVVPAYAVPAEDVRGDLVAAAGGVQEERPVRIGDGRPVLDPGTAFAAHSADGEPLTLRTPAGDLEGAAFRLTDPDLAGYVVLDFDAFDGWVEEDEAIVGHPHDPFARIDIRQGSRHVRVEAGGVVLAESTRPVLLFETHLPMRCYLPPEDVQVELRPSPTRTVCAYKGEATYWSVDLEGGPLEDVAWSYPEPLAEAARVAELVCFFVERTDTVLDGVAVPRPVTPWSDRGERGS